MFINNRNDGIGEKGGAEEGVEKGREEELRDRKSEGERQEVA
jgi:hypothetical protein